MARLITAASMLVLALGDPTPGGDSSSGDVDVDMLFSGTCWTCDKDDDDCDGYAIPLCRVADIDRPGFCDYCLDYYDLKADRTECHQRMARFTRSDFCEDLRKNEQKAKRTAQQEIDQAYEDERRDDKLKAKRAKAADEAADAAEEAAARAEQCSVEADEARETTAELQLIALTKKREAREAYEDAEANRIAAEEAAENRRDELMTAVEASKAANNAYEAAVAKRDARKAALYRARQHAVALQKEADALKEIADNS